MLLVSFTAMVVRSGDDVISCSWRRDVTSSWRTLPPVVSGGSCAGRLTVTMSAGVAGRLYQQLASCLIYSYAFKEYISSFVVDRMGVFFFAMLPSVKFAEEKVLFVFILREKC